MPHTVAWIIAAVLAAALIVVDFREARRVLRTRLHTVETAGEQLSACRRRAAQHPGDADSAAVLARCESIYLQTVANYNHTLCKPWIYLPGTLLGYRREE